MEGPLAHDGDEAIGRGLDLRGSRSIFVVRQCFHSNGRFSWSIEGVDTDTKRFITQSLSQDDIHSVERLLPNWLRYLKLALAAWEAASLAEDTRRLQFMVTVVPVLTCPLCFSTSLGDEGASERIRDLDYDRFDRGFRRKDGWEFAHCWEQSKARGVVERSAQSVGTSKTK